MCGTIRWASPPIILTARNGACAHLNAESSAPRRWTTTTVKNDWRTGRVLLLPRFPENRYDAGSTPVGRKGIALEQSRFKIRAISGTSIASMLIRTKHYWSRGFTLIELL